MKRLVEFPLGNDVILVEVDAADASRPAMRGVTPQAIIEKAQLTFDEALDKLKPAASAIVSKLRSLAERPDEISVQFGIKLHATTGAVVASAGAEANFVVTLMWRQRPGGK
jgi:hypothetical protein